MPLARGFKADAERTSEAIRAELQLKAWAPLSPWDLAEHLDIPVLPLSELDGVAAARRLFAGSESGSFSALTVFDGPRRLVVHNDAHSAGRQASNVAHELAHGLLLHEPRPALNSFGCRDWNQDMEDEAVHLSGTLLIPRAAAYVIARNGWSDVEAAQRYGCSDAMVKWRVGISGAARLRPRRR